MSQAKVLFTVAEDEKLVEMVSKFPCIYNAASPVYKDQNVKENAWKEVAQFVGRSAGDCKKRWRNIKDTYQKRQKKWKGTRKSASRKGKKWQLADMLTFLAQVDHKRESISNISYDDTNTQEIDILVDEGAATKEHDAPSTSQMTNESTQDADRTVDLIRRPNKRQRHHEKVMQMMEARRIERQDVLNKLSQNTDDEVDLLFKNVAMSVDVLDEGAATEEDDAPTTSQMTNGSTQDADITMDSIRRPNKRQRHHEKVTQMMGARRAERQDLLNQLSQNPDDEVDLFFKSIAMSVKKLRPDLINVAKMRSLQMIFDLEFCNTH